MTITAALLVNGGSIKLEATRCPYGPVARVPWPGAFSAAIRQAQRPRVTWAFPVLREREREAKPWSSDLSIARGRG